jgi:hypothetical protein
MTAPRLPQICAEATDDVKSKLAQLEDALADDSARHYEIVGVLIKRATSASVPSSELRKYRREIRAARAKLAESEPPPNQPG